MNTLPNVIRKNGFTYNRVLFKGRSYVYEQSGGYFEVFIARVRPAEVIRGRLYAEREVFPSNADFGKTAWSCRTLEDAMKRFIKMED